ncbi:hypothetical protein [Neobacillus ginsengisoli]|uniref:Group-specific protein n=1 Tax=Neobacillus ginsengisoli TaxID=904295 RepID=A0ABT9XVU0_9BACI|nr:hypothetical protein [Neobacillus ginsengisoli]MDQ0199690.1 hypothetical protein [Neobacillus ginsengisoli]
MERIELKEKTVSTAIFQFIFPFFIKDDSDRNISSFLKKQHFSAFRLGRIEDESAYYGKYQISHRDLEAFFPPFTNRILFPLSEKDKGFQRFSKALKLNGKLTTVHFHHPFQIHSIDITLCPFQLGFLTIRTEIMCPESLSFSQALEFAACFRELGFQNFKQKQLQIEMDGNTITHLEKLLFEVLVPDLTRFINKEHVRGAYFNTIPFIEKERMYVQSLIAFTEKESIELVDVYRSANLSGLTPDGKPFVTANNPDYIQQKFKQHGYDRLAPNTYYFIEENCFSCITNKNRDLNNELTKQLFGEFYYLLLLNLFHKFVFFKVANVYSKVIIEQDSKEIKELIYTINSFTSNYFFSVFPAQSQGKELFTLLRTAFSIDFFYNETKETLFSLFKYEENTVTKRDSFLLLILTMYTVICGIFSMNLFTDDLKGKIKWQHMLSYNPFEYFAVFVAFSGLIVSIILGIQSFIQGMKDRKNKKKWVRQTVLSKKK